MTIEIAQMTKSFGRTAVLRGIDLTVADGELVALLGEEGVAIDLNAAAPVVIMMVGLQGSGKTTSTAKIAKRLTDRGNRKVLMASLDTRRPAAQEQLRQGAEDRGEEGARVLVQHGDSTVAVRYVEPRCAPRRTSHISPRVHEPRAPRGRGRQSVGQDAAMR